VTQSIHQQASTRKSSISTSARASAGVQVVDKSDLRKWRTELPNLIDDIGLSLPAFRLYVHLKRRAGGDSSTVEGLRPMAKHCGMSVNTVRKARQELVDRGLVTTGEIVTDRGRFERITLLDLWEINFQYFAERRRQKQAGGGGRGVSSADTPLCHETEGGVSADDTPGVSPRDTHRKNLDKKELGRKNTHTPRAPARDRGPRSADAGVCVSQSRFSFPERKAHAERHGLGAGWLQRSRSGEYDELIADALERSRPEAIERARSAPPDNGMAYGEAVQHVASVLGFDATADPAAVIARLDVSEQTRARLVARDWGRGGSSGSPAPATPRSSPRSPVAVTP